jgi:hypothetical protein
MNEMKFSQFGASDVFLSVSVLAVGLGIFLQWKGASTEAWSSALVIIPFIGGATGALLKRPVLGWLIGAATMLLLEFVETIWRFSNMFHD